MPPNRRLSVRRSTTTTGTFSCPFASLRCHPCHVRMAITTLWLTDFRCFTEAQVEPDPQGLTVLRGPNGAGKTSVLEAVGWLATQRSLRGATRDVLVRAGTERAILRAETLIAARRVLIEAELPATGTARAQVNR